MLLPNKLLESQSSRGNSSTKEGYWHIGVVNEPSTPPESTQNEWERIVQQLKQEQTVLKKMTQELTKQIDELKIKNSKP